MNRLHVHIAVEDMEKNVRFYSALFGIEPTVSKVDYAKWEVAEPAVNFAISARDRDVGLDHVGIQTETDADLQIIRSRLEAAEIAGSEQNGSNCCYAQSDKYWAQDPQGIAWETFHTLESIPMFSDSDSSETARGCCIPAIGGEPNRC